MNNYYNSYCNPCYNRNYFEPYLGLDTIGLAWKKDCNEDVNKVKTACDKQIGDLEANVVLTSETCQNNRKIEKKNYDDNIAKLNAEITKLKQDFDSFKKSCSTSEANYIRQIGDYSSRKPVYEKQISDCNTRETDYKKQISAYATRVPIYEQQINDYNKSKASYCQRSENFRYY